MKELKFNYPFFTDQVEPKGRLLIDKRCHACWFYFMLATKNKNVVGKGPEDQIIEVDPGLETPLWMDLRYDQIARSVAMIYSLESPDEFLPYFEIVEKEANRLGFEVPFEIVTPFGVGVTRQ
jgi:hypothetical protein